MLNIKSSMNQKNLFKPSSTTDQIVTDYLALKIYHYIHIIKKETKQNKQNGSARRSKGRGT